MVAQIDTVCAIIHEVRKRTNFDFKDREPWKPQSGYYQKLLYNSHVLKGTRDIQRRIHRVILGTEEVIEHCLQTSDAKM